LHRHHPWYAEQITFMLMNTDNNHHLSRGELIEASRISPDLHTLNFNQAQLENVVDGLLSTGDINFDGKISFEEYVSMTKDSFVDQFAPTVFKRVMSK
jgi:Ca2+-binding EF-hand superfamily protein